MLSPANRPFTKSENLRVSIFPFFRLCSFRNPESYQTEWSERETFPDKTKRLAEKGGGMPVDQISNTPFDFATSKKWKEDTHN